MGHLTLEIGGVSLLVRSEGKLCAKLRPLMHGFLGESNEADCVVHVVVLEARPGNGGVTADWAKGLRTYVQEQCTRLFPRSRLGPQFDRVVESRVGGLSPYCDSERFRDCFDRFRGCEGGHIVCHIGFDHVTFLDRTEGTGTLFGLSGAWGGFPCDRRLLWLATTWSALVPPSDGLLLHAAAIVKGAQSYIFAGESGAGKTTVAERSPASNVLTDEIVAVRKVGDEVRAYSTPWRQAEGTADKSREAIVQKVFFLRHGDRTYFRECQQNEAVPWLIATEYETMYSVLVDPARTKGVFRSCCQLANNVGCYEMYFHKDRDFWCELTLLT